MECVCVFMCERECLCGIFVINGEPTPDSYAATTIAGNRTSEREIERECVCGRERETESVCLFICVCVCVCVRVCACVCV